MAELFISYAKSDRTHALDLASELREHGFSVWIDQASIGGAKNWATEIVEAIDACSTFVCLLSPHSLASHNVAKELHLASEKQKHILPVLIERVTLPSNFEYSLAGVQRVYYQDRPAIFQALELLRGIVATEELSATPISIPEDDSIRIAVLPFDDLSPLHDNQWFADGMMDELISTLGSLERVKVPPRSDVLHYRNHKKKSREIAREVGVRYLIEGGVRKAKEKIRINASLVDTVKSEQLWASKFDGTFEDIFEFQESVAKQITDALKLTLTPQEKEKVEEHGTQNGEAYELYLKGRHEQYYLTKESYLRALELYEQAAKLDRNFAKAYINIALVCCAYYREYSKDPKWIKRAETNLATAKRTTGETSRTLMIEGMIEWLRGDYNAAIETLTRSGDLDPKNYNAFNVLGNLYMAQQNYPSAAQAFQRVVDMVENTMAYFNLLAALSEDKNRSWLEELARKAIPVFDRHLLREPEDQFSAVSRGTVLYWANMMDESKNVAAQLLDREDLSGQSLYNLGCLCNYLGKGEISISLFRKAIDRGYRDVEQMRALFKGTDDPFSRLAIEQIIEELELLIQEENAKSRS